MIETYAGLELLRILARCEPGEVLGRGETRDLIKQRVPTGKAHMSRHRAMTREGRSSSDGSKVTRDLNRALRVLERVGVLERGSNDSIVVQDLSRVQELVVSARLRLEARAQKKRLG